MHRFCFCTHGPWTGVPLPLLQQPGPRRNWTRVVSGLARLHGGTESGSQPADRCAPRHQWDDQLTLPQTEQQPDQVRTKTNNSPTADQGKWKGLRSCPLSLSRLFSTQKLTLKVLELVLKPAQRSRAPQIHIHAPDKWEDDRWKSHLFVILSINWIIVSDTLPSSSSACLCAVWRVSVLWRKSPCCLCVFQEHPWWKHLWPRSPWRPQPGGLETGKQLYRQQKDPAISFFMRTCFLKCHLKTPENQVNY